MTDQEIPEELKHLLPKTEKILMGEEVVDIKPLPWKTWKELLTRLRGVIGEVFTPEFIKTVNEENDDESGVEGSVGATVIDFMKDHIGPILSMAIGRSEEEIEAVITAEQITYALQKLWEMNMKKAVVDVRTLIDSFTSELPDLSDTVAQTMGAPEKVVEEEKGK